jgi:hypothetical protein
LKDLSYKVFRNARPLVAGQIAEPDEYMHNVTMCGRIQSGLAEKLFSGDVIALYPDGVHPICHELSGFRRWSAIRTPEYVKGDANV